MDWPESNSAGKALGVLAGSRQRAVHEPVVCLGDEDGQEQPGLHGLHSLIKEMDYSTWLSTY